MLCHLAFGYVLDVFWEPRSLLSMGEYLIILAGQNLRIFSAVFKTLRLPTLDFEGFAFANCDCLVCIVLGVVRIAVPSFGCSGYWPS